MDPANAATSTGGSRFKEGNVRVINSTFAVNKSGGVDSKATPVTALVWTVERLDDDLAPLTDEDNNPLIEKLAFSLGGKSLPKVHPGKGDSPDDDAPEDLGDEVDTEGNTLVLVDETFRPHEKSGIMHLVKSLHKAGWKPEYSRMWAPDYKGLVAFMQPFADKDVMIMSEYSKKEEPVNYKVVTKIHTAPYEKKGSKAVPDKGDKSDKPAAEGAKAANPADDLAQAILEKIITAKDGNTLTKKALMLAATQHTTKLEPKLQVPVMSLFKEDKWLNLHIGKGYTVDTDDDGKIISLAFGEQPDDSAGE